VSAVGIRDEYVDTQDVSLNVSTEDFTFTQLTNVRLNREHDVTTHYLTNDTVERIVNLEIPSIEGDIVLTVPEIAFWKGMQLKDSQGLLLQRNWTLNYTSQNNATAFSILRNGKVVQFYIIDSGLGALTHHFLIEGDGVT